MRPPSPSPTRSTTAPWPCRCGTASPRATSTVSPTPCSPRWKRRRRRARILCVTVAANHLLSAALDLSEPERVELASRLLASVEDAYDPAWEEAWLAELDRRTAAAA